MVESYLEPSRTSTLEPFAKIINDKDPVTIFVKKAPSQMFDWILHVHLQLFLHLIYSLADRMLLQRVK